MILSKVHLISYLILLSLSFSFGQDTLSIKPKKLVYRPDGIYTERLLMYATDLGKRTNNSEILDMTYKIRNNVKLQKGFGIAAITAGIVWCGSIAYAVSQPLTTTVPVTMMAIGLFSGALTITFSISSLVNNGIRQNDSRKLTELYNNVLN